MSFGSFHREVAGSILTSFGLVRGWHLIAGSRLVQCDRLPPYGCSAVPLSDRREQLKIAFARKLCYTCDTGAKSCNEDDF